MMDSNGDGVINIPDLLNLLLHMGDDSPCFYDYGLFSGCTNSTACNYNPQSLIEDGSCEFESCAGCVDPQAINYDPESTIDNGSCIYEIIEKNISSYKTRNLLYITDIMGREVDDNTSGVLLYHYDDGSTDKIFNTTPPY